MSVWTDTYGDGHYHVVVSGGASIEADHAAWHETGDPCLVCDRRRWTSCPGAHPGQPFNVCWSPGK